jgi:putative Mg2+ transporter-C (MgtC) family protein
MLDWIQTVEGATTWAMFIQCAVKFSLAVGLAGLVGYERQRKGRPAGLRTHILVCLGSTLLMTMSDTFAGEWVEGGAPVWFDRGRVAAGIVTGVGFLGAGTIITIGSKQHGLTTAAMIWFVASLGVALGSGYYLIAALATAFALSVVVGMGAMEHILPSRGYFSLKLRMKKGHEPIETVIASLKELGSFRVRTSRVRWKPEETELTLSIETLTVREFDALAKIVEEKFSGLIEVQLEG